MMCKENPESCLWWFAYQLLSHGTRHYCFGDCLVRHAIHMHSQVVYSHTTGGDFDTHWAFRWGAWIECLVVRLQLKRVERDQSEYTEGGVWVGEREREREREGGGGGGGGPTPPL